jgi:hypothetical protein
MEVTEQIRCKGCGALGKAEFSDDGNLRRPLRVSEAFYLHETTNKPNEKKIACNKCHQIYAG